MEDNIDKKVILIKEINNEIINLDKNMEMITSENQIDIDFLELLLSMKKRLSIRKQELEKTTLLDNDIDIINSEQINESQYGNNFCSSFCTIL